MATDPSPFDKKLNGGRAKLGVGHTSVKQLRLQIARINRTLRTKELTIEQQITFEKLLSRACKQLDVAMARKEERERKAPVIERTA